MGQDLVGRVSNLARKMGTSIAAVLALATPAYGQFGPIRNVTEINSGFEDHHAVVSKDNLHVFFASAPSFTFIYYAERGCGTVKC